MGFENTFLFLLNIKMVEKDKYLKLIKSNLILTLTLSSNGTTKGISARIVIFRVSWVDIGGGPSSTAILDRMK